MGAGGRKACATAGRAAPAGVQPRADVRPAARPLNFLSTWRNVLTVSPGTAILGFLTSLHRTEEGSALRVGVED